MADGLIIAGGVSISKSESEFVWLSGVVKIIGCKLEFSVLTALSNNSSELGASRGSSESLDWLSETDSSL